MYRGAFSLRNEIGICPHIEVELQVIDMWPFLIRPSDVNEDEKLLTDKEMQRLVCLGILKQDMSQYSSPIIITARKNSNLKRIVTDFRF